MPWWVVAGAGVIVAIAMALWWGLPKWQVNLLRQEIPDAKARADVEDNFRKTIGQLLGGAVVPVGAGFAYYQTQLTSQASRDQVISQQVSKGFEQLGSDKIVVRLGGIYALEGVMNTSEQYHQPVLEALCAFVRDGTKADTDRRPLATDIQAAITVIGRRAAGTGVVDLTGSHISKANLTKADLRLAHLGTADLSDADLSHAKLSHAKLSHAKLTKAHLIDADLIDADLSGADLRLAHLVAADLSDADLSGADLTNADLNTTQLNGADLGGAHLSGADLSGTHVSQSQLDKACGNKGTRLPSGLTIKLC